MLERREALVLNTQGFFGSRLRMTLVAPPDSLLDGVAGLLGSRPVACTRAPGGFTIAERWTLDLADGRRVFAKMATSKDLARRLRLEHRNMQAAPPDLRCEILAWQNGERPLLVVEDLSHGHWPPPWESGDVERVLQCLDRLWATPTPDFFGSAEADRKTFRGWSKIAAAPEGFLGLGLCSVEWLDRHLPTLVAAEQAAVLDGTDFLHLDIRSDNLALLQDRVVLVDWNFACRGRRDIDLALWLPSLRLEGGPLPEEVADLPCEYAAAWTGVLANGAHQLAPRGAPTVRAFQLRQLRVALPWTCRRLGLPDPDPDRGWGGRAIEKIDADLATGLISDDEWHALTEEIIGDAYLSYPEPWRQSGKSGDEEEWRWSRELILDALPNPGGAFLDVGCANGYLMECVQRWGGERGLRVEPHGVDISWRLASLARRRLPRWADRIYTGNALTWTPPRRFDLVNTGLDYVPAPHRRQLVEHLLRDFLTPAGRLVLRPERVRPGVPSPAEQLEDLGFKPAGILESRHPQTGEVRLSAWLGAY